MSVAASSLTTDRLTSVEQPKIPIQAPAVALGSELHVPLPCDGLAVGEKRNEREQSIEADESCRLSVKVRRKRPARNTNKPPQDPVVPVSPAQPEQRQGDRDLEEPKRKRCFNHRLKELRRKQLDPVCARDRTLVFAKAILALEDPRDQPAYAAQLITRHGERQPCPQSSKSRNQESSPPQAP